MPDTSLIVVNYNSAAHTARLVDMLAPSVDEVVVVDNASPDGAAALASLPDRHSNLRLLCLETNRGYGAGANAGAAASARGNDVLVVANPDVTIEPAAFARLTAAVTRDQVALAAPMFLDPDGTLQRSAHRRDPGFVSTVFELCRPLAGLVRRLAPGWHPTLLSAAAHATSRDCAHVLGALMAIRRKAFDAVGGFDETFFLYREETDLCRRLRTAGWRIRHVADATAEHEGGASTADGTPTMYRPTALTSHYRYIAKHRGRAVAGIARLLGTASCLLWILVGPKRSRARALLRWHLGLDRFCRPHVAKDATPGRQNPESGERC
ncbi:MAG: glycosyltransferase family 2 protein [Acidimicrobiales bacterium]